MTQNSWLLRRSKNVPVPDAISDHIAAYETKFGVTPNQLLVHTSVLDEAQAATEIPVRGQRDVAPHEVMLRYQGDGRWEK